MNPFDWAGPDFLVFYLILLAAAVPFAIYLRRALRIPDDEPSAEAFNINAYEVAYLAGGAPILQLKSRGVPVVPHGVSLSLGGAEPLDQRRLTHLARLAERLEAPLVSEHIAFVRGGGRETGHLLPMPRTKAAIELFAANIRTAQEALRVPLALENVANLFEWPAPEMDEAAFLCEVLEQADVLLLLDVENVYANARNHRSDPHDFLSRIPLERVAYIHVAGGIERDGLYHDTHAHSVPREVLELLGAVCQRAAVPGVMLEWDDQFPSDGELNAQLDAIRGAMTQSGAGVAGQ